jgi:hypothetical protein
MQFEQEADRDYWIKSFLWRAQKIYFYLQDAWIWFLSDNLRANPRARLRDSYQGVFTHLRAAHAFGLGPIRYMYF